MKTLLALFFLFSANAFSTSEPAATPAAAPTIGIDELSLDRTIAPCTDFYQYACGGWLKSVQIPNDLPAWSRGIYSLREEARAELHAILEKYAKSNVPDDDPDRERLGNYFFACMDEKEAEKTSMRSLKAEFARIDAIKSPEDLSKKIADLHLKGVDVLFGFGPDQSCKDSSQMVGNADQGGLGLPDPDYYLKDEGKNPAIRTDYQEHLVRMLSLAGFPASKAKAGAKTIFALETSLAKGFLSRTERRDPKKLCNLLGRAGLATRAPIFKWQTYYAGLGLPEVQSINVAVPDYFNKLNEVLTSTPLADLKVYLKWHVLDRMAGAMGKKIVEQNFAFVSKAFSGQKEIEPRWKRCVSSTERAMGEPLGRAYTRLKFNEESKTKARVLISGIESAFGQELEEVEWMDEVTKKKATEKLHALVNQIGYPDKWRDFSQLTISRKDFFANALAASRYNSNYHLNKIEKPVDRTEWEMFPQTVNAYYSGENNKMVFPAGILQYPFFDPGNPVAVNFGGIGMVMGHELTHGFDDEGRQFDQVGNLTQWWTEKTEKAFNERAACLVKQYDGYTPIDDLHVRGKLTLGENIADNGGIKLAYNAFMKIKGDVGTEQKGFTQEQLFFLGFAQSWCSLKRPELERQHLITDPHSPPKFRVNGPISNFPAFAKAFSCPADSAMVRKPACEVW